MPLCKISIENVIFNVETDAQTVKLVGKTNVFLFLPYQRNSVHLILNGGQVIIRNHEMEYLKQNILDSNKSSSYYCNYKRKEPEKSSFINFDIT